MNLKSVLCAAALLATASVAQAFPDFQLSPASGQEKKIAADDEIFALSIQFDDWEFDWNYSLEFVDFKNVQLYNISNGQDAVCIKAQQMGQMVMFNFDPDQLREYGSGEYELTIPEGTFNLTTKEDASAEAEKLNQAKNPKITATYTIQIEEKEVVEKKEWTPIEFVSIDPAGGSKLALWGGAKMPKVFINTSDNAAVNYISWTLTDENIEANPEEYPDMVAQVAQGDDNRLDANKQGVPPDKMTDRFADGLCIYLPDEDQYATKLVEGHTYRLDFRCCGIGADWSGPQPQFPRPDQLDESEILKHTVKYEGATPAAVYSKITVVKVSPDPEEYKIETVAQAMFDVEYSGPVKPKAFTTAIGSGAGLFDAGTWAPFEGMTADENGLCTKWTFTFKESIVKNATGQITVNVQAVDANDDYVKGNVEGLEYDNYNYQITWNCNAGAPAIVSVTPEDNATVESLSTITVTNDKNGNAEVMSCNDDNRVGPARILNMDMEELLVLEKPIFSEDGLSATWTFEPIVEEGTYILQIPEHYFMLGEDMNNYISNSANFRYYVEAAKVVKYDIEPESVKPAAGSVVESIKDVVLTFSETTFHPMDGSVKINLVQGDKTLQTLDMTEAEQVEDNNMFNPTVYTLHFTEVKEAGTYQVVIPKGAFCDDEFDVSMGETGHASEEIVLNYTVAAPAAFTVEPVKVTPANNENVAAIATVTVEFGRVIFPMQNGEGPDMTLVPAVLSKVDGEKVTELQSVVPTDNDPKAYLEPKVYDFKFEEVKEDGQYKVVIAAGTFGDDAFLGSEGKLGVANPEIVLNYVIGATVGVEAIVGGASTINVYDLNGVQLLKDANVEAAKELKSGLYIINGKKVMIRR